MIIKEEIGEKTCLRYRLSGKLILGNGVYGSLWSGNCFPETIKYPHIPWEVSTHQFENLQYQLNINNRVYCNNFICGTHSVLIELLKKVLLLLCILWLKCDAI